MATKQDFELTIDVLKENKVIKEINGRNHAFFNFKIFLIDSNSDETMTTRLKKVIAEVNKGTKIVEDMCEYGSE